MSKVDYLTRIGWSEELIKHYFVDDDDYERVITADKEIVTETIDSNQYSFEIYACNSSSIEVPL